MSISKLGGGRSAVSRWQLQHESAEISKNDEILSNGKEIYTNKLTNHSGVTHTPTAVSCISGISSSTSSSVARHLSSPVSANIQSNVQLQQQLQPQTYLPQTSLLKIRPFVPSLNTRLRRPIGRSYSTLSSTFAKRTLTTTINTNNNNINTNNNTTATITATANGHWGQGQGPIRHELISKNAGSVIVGAAIDRNIALSKVTRSVGNVRRRTIKVITHQRSKSTSSSAASTSASNRPTTAVANGYHQASIATSTACAIVTPQPNGICRIARLPREQEKLPDRINYDRRGLTAIPIFENELNLRLLSLQHNLINVFHIPKEQPNSEVTPYIALDKAETNVQLLSNGEPHIVNGSKHSKASNDSNMRAPQTSPSPITGHTIDTIAMTMLISASTPPPQPVQVQLLKRNNLLQNLNLSLNTPQVLHPHNQQQQQQRQSHHRFAMKKSKSFITNYTRQVNSAKRSTPKATPNGTEAKMLILLGRTNLKSFDSSASGMTNDSLSTMVASELEEEDVYRQQLEIKNRQLHPSYGLIFKNLVFLDLYDNQIERIANLDGLPTLSVLLLGKNRITDISGLVSLRATLRVLDLHGNKITSISNKINCLQGLKSLNLAGNQIRQINQNDFNGLQNLKELNLKRNRIRRVNGFQHLVALERLWLCHNDIHKVEDMSSIAKATSLLEVTIENNPVSLAGDCVSFLVSYLSNLQSLSQMPITEQVRRAAMAWRKNKELSEANHAHHSSEVFNNIRREEVISNARTNWELLRSQQTMQATLKGQRSPKQRELTKINESNEITVGYDDLQEYIKLPPIQQQQPICQQQQDINATNEQNEIDQQSRSSNSSLGPNVDSSSSSYSSDNEETPKKKNEQRNRVKKLQTPLTMRKKAQASNQHHQLQQQEQQQNNKKQNEPNSELTPTNDSKDIDNIKTVSPTNANASQEKHSINQTVADANVNTEDCKRTYHNPSILGTTNKNNTMENSNPANSFPESTVHDEHAQQQLRAPTPITAITTNSSLLCLGYNHESYEATAASTFASTSTTTSTIISTTIATATTTITITSSSSSSLSSTLLTTTSGTATTCRRYMRGSLMRSQVVVGSVGSYSSNVGGGTSAVGGKLRLATRNNVTVVNGQPSSNSIAPAQIPAVAPKTPTIDYSIISTTTPTTSTSNPVQPNPSSSSNALIAVSTPTVAIASTTPITPTTTITTANTTIKLSALEREREQGGDYLIEICGRYLNIYGQGALRFIDKQWNPAKANDVHTLNFSYINFNNIVSVLGRIKVRFPHAEHFVFRETNISCLGQLNALAELQGITSLFIDPEGNAITAKDLWRQYAIYRLSHWGLKLLNSIEISTTEIEEANDMYSGLSDLVLWSMPDIMLHPLLARLRLDETCTASKMSPKDWLMKPENKSLRLVVGKEALQWKKPSTSAMLGSVQALPKSTAFNLGQQTNNYLLNGHQQQQQQQQSYSINDLGEGLALGTIASETVVFSNPNFMALSTRERGKIHFTVMMENTCNAIEKLHKLETLWPSLLLDIVRNTLLDYSQMDSYLRNLMAEIMK